LAGRFKYFFAKRFAGGRNGAPPHTAGEENPSLLDTAKPLVELEISRGTAPHCDGQNALARPSAGRARAALPD
jgi:hypothetical protein